MAPTLITHPLNYPYTAVDLTEEVTLIPNTYGRIEAMGLMPGEGMVTTFVEIFIEDGILNLLPARERGAPGTVARRGLRRSLTFKIPHIPHDDKIAAADLQDRIVIRGGQRVLAGPEDATAKALMSIRQKHAITREYMRMSALKGNIVDGEANALYDLYDAFGITAKAVDFVLGTTTTNIEAKCREVVAHIEDNLLGDTMTSVRALVSGTFFDRLRAHAKVAPMFEGTALNYEMSRGYLREFQLGGVIFEEYRGVATDAAGNTRRFITDGEGHAFPIGTMDTFKTYDAPPDHWDYVNAVGPEVFVSPKILDHGKGVELHSESNPLPFCRRPQTLVRLHSSN